MDVERMPTSELWIRLTTHRQRVESLSRQRNAWRVAKSKLHAIEAAILENEEIADAIETELNARGEV